MMVKRSFAVLLLVLMVIFVGCGGEEDSGGVATVVGTVPAIGSQIDPDGVLVINFDDGSNIEGGVVTVNGDSISLVNNQATVVFSVLPVGKPFTFDVSWRNTDGTQGSVDTVFRVNQLEPEVADGIQQPLDEMVLIPAGSFEMGDHFDEGNNDERPVHRVTLDAFYMDAYEVSERKYKKFLRATGRRPLPVDEGLPQHLEDGRPVVGVSWHDATAYAKWAGKRLPTEAEWEYAARGGLSGKRNLWGDNDDDDIVRTYANIFGKGPNSLGYWDKWDYLAPIGQFEANGYGLYDIAGNAWEWCSDWWNSDYYIKSSLRNPQGPSSGSSRVLRGGYFGSHGVFHNLRVADRYGADPTNTDIRRYYGFRCVMDVEE